MCPVYLGFRVLKLISSILYNCPTFPKVNVVLDVINVSPDENVI
jgi:hypothetical protein